MLRWRIYVPAVWYGRVRRGSVVEHWHVCRGRDQLMGGCVSTSFFRFDLFHIVFDTRSSHHLARILSKECFRGCVFLSYPHQPASTSVHFACLWFSPLYIMIVICTLYYVMYIFRVSGNRMIVDVPFCVWFSCWVVPWLWACSLVCVVCRLVFHIR